MNSLWKMEDIIDSATLPVSHISFRATLYLQNLPIETLKQVWSTLLYMIFWFWKRNGFIIHAGLSCLSEPDLKLPIGFQGSKRLRDKVQHDFWRSDDRKTKQLIFNPVVCDIASSPQYSRFISLPRVEETANAWGKETIRNKIHYW